MKRYIYIPLLHRAAVPALLLTLALLTFTSCADDGLRENWTGDLLLCSSAHYLDPSTTTLPLSCEAGTSVLTIEAPATRWRLTGLPDWLTADAVSGYDDATVLLTYTANPSVTDLRTATLTLASDEEDWTYSISITVTQKSQILVSSITLSTSSLSLTEGDTSTLTATVSPSNATNKELTWSSTNTKVATVNSNGVVTAVSAGTATITCKAADGSGVKATCAVTIAASGGGDDGGDGDLNGHAYVDLGLPSGLLWATCNVGASSPGDYGNYYAWGETTSKSDYSLSAYKYSGHTDSHTVLESSDDAATANWGGSWRMPTHAEWVELNNSSNCTWTWTTQDGHDGYKVTSVKNGNSIFLPAAGCRYDTSLSVAGSYGHYWSSSLGESSPGYAWDCYFYSSSHGADDSYSRCSGRSVRPVAAP